MFARDAIRDSVTSKSHGTAKRNDAAPSRPPDEVARIKETGTRPGDISEVSGTRPYQVTAWESTGTIAGTLLDDAATLQSTERDRIKSTDHASIPRASQSSATLKLNDLPILRPPEAFRAPIFRCKAPTLAWQHCGCPSHSHLPPRRSSVIWSALKRCHQEPFYRTWPNRAARRIIRPSRRTVGTQSSFDGSRSSLGTLRCVVRSIDMTERSMDLEIGATIPF